MTPLKQFKRTATADECVELAEAAATTEDYLFNHLDLEMREALTLALQGFDGAMVIVSHDRHLLRTTTDDLYLVHGGRVEVFDGDLDDYHKWLLDLEKSQSNQEAGAEAGSNSAAARKDQKRREADFRQTIRPLKQQLEKLEKRMEKLQGELAEIEQALADPELYSEGAKAKLTGLLAKQGPVKNQLGEVELEWMTLSENLEQKEQAFADGQ